MKGVGSSYSVVEKYIGGRSTPSNMSQHVTESSLGGTGRGIRAKLYDVWGMSSSDLNKIGVLLKYLSWPREQLF